MFSFQNSFLEKKNRKVLAKQKAFMKLANKIVGKMMKKLNIFLGIIKLYRLKKFIQLTNLKKLTKKIDIFYKKKKKFRLYI